MVIVILVLKFGYFGIINGLDWEWVGWVSKFLIFYYIKIVYVERSWLEMGFVFI